MNRVLIGYCKELNITGQHSPDSRMADDIGNGWPDWVFVGKRILYREVKGSNDLLSPAQRAVARRIMCAGGDWAVYRPGDLYPGGRARKELESISLKGILT